jgi:hypothetical protein
VYTKPAMERTKRTGGKKKKAQKLSALEQLRLAREGGSRNEQFVEEDEEDIYDVVAEEDYHDLVKKRQEREDFVVDDDGIGYIDDGEEHQLNDAPRDNGRRKSGTFPYIAMRPAWRSFSSCFLLPVHNAMQIIHENSLL